MKEIINQLREQNKIFKINENMIEFESNVLINNFKLRIFVKKEDGKFFLTDNKLILKNMNQLYELKSQDVQKCIHDVVDLYNFNLSKAEISTEIKDIKELKKRINDLIICAGQLLNMYVFFDEPAE